jgi:hypothetical protein
MIRTMTGRLLGIGAIAATFIGGASSAKATPIVYDLTIDHCTGGCGTAPFGNISLNQNGTTVDLTVHLNAGNQFVLTGAGDFQDFKFNATGVVLADITVDAHAPALTADTGTFNGDGTGSFGFGITCPSCGNGGSGAFTPDIVFHVANATIADLTAPNNDGFIFVADMLSAQTGNTGPVGVSTPRTPTVPEPMTSALIGTGLMSLFFLRRRTSR